MNTIENALNGISTTLVENARIELNVKKIISDNNLLSRTGDIYNTKSISFFIENHNDKLCFYKQQKKNGYSVILLFKGVAMVGVADFMTEEGRKIESMFKEVNNLPIYQAAELKRKVLKNIFIEPWDKRKSASFKPTAEKTWETLEKFLML